MSGIKKITSTIFIGIFCCYSSIWLMREDPSTTCVEMGGGFNKTSGECVGLKEKYGNEVDFLEIVQKSGDFSTFITACVLCISLPLIWSKKESDNGE